jgi:hypothetical protein
MNAAHALIFMLAGTPISQRKYLLRQCCVVRLRLESLLYCLALGWTVTRGGSSAQVHLEQMSELFSLVIILTALGK